MPDRPGRGADLISTSVPPGRVAEAGDPTYLRLGRRWFHPKNGQVVLRFSLLSLALVLGSILGCAGVRPPGPGAEPEGGPTITRLSPSSGQAGEAYPIEVTIEGLGFAEAGNIVKFGGIPSEGLPSSASGTRITFWVPKEVPSAGEASPMVLTPGEYPVTVTTPTGTSESVLFLLTPGE